jgi:hypothetical protein
MTRKALNVVAGLGLFILLFGASRASAQVAPTLGAAAHFGVLGGSAVTGSTGSGTLVNGDVGSYPTPTISNFPPSSTVPPYIVHNSADAVVQQAHSDAATAQSFLAGQTGTTINDDLSTDGVLGPGVYTLGAANLPASTTLTLNGSGIFIFNISSTLTLNVSSVVTGTANPCNVYWQVGTSATLNDTSMIGTVLAAASITVGGGIVTGRVLAGTAGAGAVTMPGSGGNTIGGCSAPPPSCPTITLSPSTLPNGTVNVAYNQTITGNGGTAPYSFAIASGTIPAGLNFTSAGILSGTPTTATTYNFSIRGTDANGCAGTQAYTIVIVAAPPPPPTCPTITLSPATLPGGTVAVAYSQTITGNGGTAPYTFGVTVGTLPSGLTLTSSGLLAGTPITNGTSNFTIRGMDANGCFATLAYSIVIVAAPPPPPSCPTIALAPATLPNGTMGVAYSQTITGSGGASPYSFGVTAGSLPTGLTLSSTGLLSGTPSASGSSTFTIRATDNNGCFAERSYTIVIAIGVPMLPWIFVVFLVVGLMAIGYIRLRRRPLSRAV